MHVEHRLLVSTFADLHDRPADEHVPARTDVIRDLAREGMTMLIVTHEMGFARDVSHKVMMFDGGRVVEEGHPEKIFTAPEHERTRKFLGAVLGH